MFLAREHLCTVLLLAFSPYMEPLYGTVIAENVIRDDWVCAGGPGAPRCSTESGSAIRWTRWLKQSIGDEGKDNHSFKPD